MFRKFTNTRPLNDTIPINPKNPRTRYREYEGYIILEFNVDKGKQYITVYLRPYENNKTIITAYLPELDYLEDLRLFNKLGLLKLLCRSTKFAEIYRAGSEISASPFLSIVQDFTEDVRKIGKMCLHKIVNLPITPSLMDSESQDYVRLANGINKIIEVANEYLRVYRKHLKDISCAYWMKNKINPSIAEAVVKKSNNGLYGNFICKTTIFSSPDIRGIIEKNKIAILCKNDIYPIGSIISDEDKHNDAIVILLAEIFAPSLKGSGYILCVGLEYKYDSWKVKANLGELVEQVSNLFNHINTKEWAKIEKYEYQKMPNTANLWYYSNPYHEGTIIENFVNEGDKTDYGVMEPKVLVEEPSYITVSWPYIECDRLWEDLSFSQIEVVIRNALTVIYEVENYIPSKLKKILTEVAIDVTMVMINPYRYVLNKIMGKK